MSIDRPFIIPFTQNSTAQRSPSDRCNCNEINHDHGEAPCSNRPVVNFWGTPIAEGLCQDCFDAWKHP